MKATLLKLITKVRPLPFRHDGIKSIIILRYDRIGDMIVSLPLCKALKLGLENVTVTMIASEVNACIAEESEFIDDTVIKPSRLFNWLRTLLILRARKYDIAIDLNHSVTPHTILAIRIIKPKHVASPFKDGRWGVTGTQMPMFDLMPPEHELKYARPISQTYLDIARLIGCPAEDCFPYPLHKHTHPHQFQSNFVVVNPTGSRKPMRLPDRDLFAIIKHLITLDPSLCIVIPAMQDDYADLFALFNDIPEVKILSPTRSILPLLPVIQFSRLVITPDTALVHIACAYGTPLVAIYSSDEALFQQWRPYVNPNTSVIRSKEQKGLAGYSLPTLLSSISNQLHSRRTAV